MLRSHRFFNSQPAIGRYKARLHYCIHCICMWSATTSPLRSQLFAAPAPGPAVASCRAVWPLVCHQRCAATTTSAHPPAAAEKLAATMTVELQADVPAAASAAPIEDRKLRILCLHGYLQNAEVGALDHSLRVG